MNKLNIILLITFILVVLVAFTVILFKYYNDKIKEIIKKTDDSEKNLHDKINEKYEILIKLIDIVENKLKINSKTFEEVKKLKDKSLIKNEITLNKCYKEIMDIKDDNSSSKKYKSFRDTLNSYDENELHIISLRTFYNKYTMEYNNLIKKIPFNIVSKIKKYKLKLLLEGKEIDDED